MCCTRFSFVQHRTKTRRPGDDVGRGLSSATTRCPAVDHDPDGGLDVRSRTRGCAPRLASTSPGAGPPVLTRERRDCSTARTCLDGRAAAGRGDRGRCRARCATARSPGRLENSSRFCRDLGSFRDNLSTSYPQGGLAGVVHHITKSRRRAVVRTLSHRQVVARSCGSGTGRFHLKAENTPAPSSWYATSPDA